MKIDPLHFISGTTIALSKIEEWIHPSLPRIFFKCPLTTSLRLTDFFLPKISKKPKNSHHLPDEESVDYHLLTSRLLLSCLLFSYGDCGAHPPEKEFYEDPVWRQISSTFNEKNDPLFFKRLTYVFDSLGSSLRVREEKTLSASELSRALYASSIVTPGRETPLQEIIRTLDHITLSKKHFGKLNIKIFNKNNEDAEVHSTFSSSGTSFQNTIRIKHKSEFTIWHLDLDQDRNEIVSFIQQDDGFLVKTFGNQAGVTPLIQEKTRFAQAALADLNVFSKLYKRIYSPLPVLKSEAHGITFESNGDEFNIKEILTIPHWTVPGPTPSWMMSSQSPSFTRANYSVIWRIKTGITVPGDNE